MRRLLSLMLIVASGWMLYQACGEFSGLNALSWAENVGRAVTRPQFALPVIGSVLGLLGGLTVFFDGRGGATIAFLGGLLASGFSLATGQTLYIPDLRFWDSDIAVGVAMVLIALWAAVTRPNAT